MTPTADHDHWLEVAIELKKAANATISFEMQTLSNGSQYLLKTQKMTIRILRKSEGIIEIRSADFTNGILWQAKGDESAKVLNELSEVEVGELWSSS